MGTDTLGTGLPWVDAIARSFAPRPFADFHRRELPELVVNFTRDAAALLFLDLEQFFGEGFELRFGQYRGDR